MNYSFAVQRVTCCHRRRGQAVGCLVRRAPSRSSTQFATVSVKRRQLTNLQRNFPRSFEGWHGQKLVA